MSNISLQKKLSALLIKSLFVEKEISLLRINWWKILCITYMFSDLSIVVVAGPTGKRPVPIGCKNNIIKIFSTYSYFNGNWIEENKVAVG